MLSRPVHVEIVYISYAASQLPSPAAPTFPVILLRFLSTFMKNILIPSSYSPDPGHPPASQNCVRKNTGIYIIKRKNIPVNSIQQCLHKKESKNTLSLRGEGGHTHACEKHADREKEPEDRPFNIGFVPKGGSICTKNTPLAREPSQISGPPIPQLPETTQTYEPPGNPYDQLPAR